jgi:hypothetical protein
MKKIICGRNEDGIFKEIPAWMQAWMPKFSAILHRKHLHASSSRSAIGPGMTPARAKIVAAVPWSRLGNGQRGWNHAHESEGPGERTRFGPFIMPPFLSTRHFTVVFRHGQSFHAKHL